MDQPMTPQDGRPKYLGKEASGNPNDVVEVEMVQKGVAAEDPTRTEGDEVVTWKTWFVVYALAASYGISFWSVPSLATIQSQLALKLNEPSQTGWIVSVYNIAATIAFMVCGSNSDLFGRRWFLILGNLAVVIGSIVAGTANTVTALSAGMAITGFGGGNCQLAAFALPELLPNKWRHIGVVIADAVVLVAIILGPVTARFAITNGSGNGWRWILYASTIGNGLAGLFLFFYYYPPQHPRGIPFRQALRELDYVGAILFSAAASLVLVGVVYASYIPSNSPKVIGTLVSGFVSLVAFGIWETWAPLKQPLAPPRLFAHNHGRTLTAPFIVTMMVGMYYLGTNVVWSTMINVLFTSETSPSTMMMKLSLAQGLGIFTGGTSLAFFGSKIGRWKWSQLGSVLIMTIFGGLLALGTPERRGMMIAFCYLSATGYGWAQYLSMTYTQFGADQVELGIAGGLAGVGRYAGQSIASTVYVTILSNAVSSHAKNVITAAMNAGASLQTAQEVLAALPSGSAAVMAVDGVTATIAAAAGEAFVGTYVIATRTVALCSIAFGGLGAVACLFLEDLTPKMTNTIETYLENDVNATKNKYH